MYCQTIKTPQSVATSNTHGNTELTFSIPQNLSLPSLRSGPAFSNIRCNGVIWGAFGSGLPFAGDVALALRLSVLLLSLPKKEDMMPVRHLQLSDLVGVKVYWICSTRDILCIMFRIEECEQSPVVVLRWRNLSKAAQFLSKTLNW